MWSPQQPKKVRGMTLPYFKGFKNFLISLARLQNLSFIALFRLYNLQKVSRQHKQAESFVHSKPTAISWSGALCVHGMSEVIFVFGQVQVMCCSFICNLCHFMPFCKVVITLILKNTFIQACCYLPQYYYSVLVSVLLFKLYKSIPQ